MITFHFPAFNQLSFKEMKETIEEKIYIEFFKSNTYPPNEKLYLNKCRPENFSFHAKLNYTSAPVLARLDYREHINNHWHFEISLFEVNSDGNIIAHIGDIIFCILDNEPVLPYKEYKEYEKLLNL